MWAAVRVGYRDSYTAGGPLTPETAALFSFFTTQVEGVETPVDTLVDTLVDTPVDTLRPLRAGPAYDLEVDLTATPTERMREVLDGLRHGGRAVRSALISWEIETLSQARAAVTTGAAMSVLRGGVPDEETAAAIRAATNGRLTYSTPFSQPDVGRITAILKSLR